MTDDRIKNRTAINQLVSEFLELPIVEISEKPDGNKQRERYFRLIDIAERVGSGHYDHVEIVGLFTSLECKANEMINQYMALSHAKHQEELIASGLLNKIDPRLFRAVEDANKNRIEKAKSKHGKDANSKRKDRKYQELIKSEIIKECENNKGEYESKADFVRVNYRIWESKYENLPKERTILDSWLKGR